ncbi:MAG: hypothetical protein JNJ46_00760 [Myxococcales bacterium]|nr:hypothetical protein [Myxococcales bacterium]
MHARSVLGLWLGLLLCSQRPSLASEPDSASSPAPSSESARASHGDTASTLRVRVDGNRLRILREEHTGAVTLGTLTLPAQARDAALLIGRAAYVALEGQGTVAIDIGVPEDPYIVWHLAKDRIITSLLLWQDRLQLEALQQSFDYDVSDPLRPRGREIIKVAARRFYAASPAAQDAEGLPRFGADAPPGRRLRMRSGEILVGHLHRQGAGRYLLCPTGVSELVRVEAGTVASASASPQPCEGRMVSAQDIQRVDAVYLDEAAPENAATPTRPQPGLTTAISRLPKVAQPADAQVLSALLDGSAGPLLYRVRGPRFEILRRTGSEEVLLGVATLPHPGRSSTLLFGSAAYVLMEQGVAVIDIALARYPYVAWVLEPTVEVERMQVQKGMLILQEPNWAARYNLALPLLPSGPNRQAVDWRRHADQSATAVDASWVERTESSFPAARRLYLRGSAAQLVWDFRCRADTARCEYHQGGNAGSAPLVDIEHVEAVYAVPGATSTAAVVPVPNAPAPPAPPGYSWTHLTGVPGTRLVRTPARIAGIVFAGIGGGVALVSAVAFFVLHLPIPVGGGVPLGDGSSKIPLGVSAGVGLGVGLVGSIVAIASKDQRVQMPANQ